MEKRETKLVSRSERAASSRMIPKVPTEKNPPRDKKSDLKAESRLKNLVIVISIKSCLEREGGYSTPKRNACKRNTKQPN